MPPDNKVKAAPVLQSGL